MSTDKNQHLDAVLQTHRIELDETKLNAYQKERDHIKEALDQHYAGRMYTPLNSGSYAKKTAINTKFDLDLAVPFKRGEFKTLKEMSDDVEAYLRSIAKQSQYPITQVTAQRRSINLLLNVDGMQLDMDIVPGRELNDGQYEEDKKLNLYDSQTESSIQTNIKAHIELLSGKVLERDIIKLLKVWKTKHNPSMKSFLVELMILSAFDHDSTLADKKLYGRLAGSLDYMAKNITTIRLVDPANSNNVVSDTLTTTEKDVLRIRIERMLDEIDKDLSKLQHYFPINKAYEGIIDPSLLSKFKNRPNSPGPNSFA